MPERFIHRVIFFPGADARNTLTTRNHRSGRQLAAKVVNQGSLADARLARNKHDPALALIALTILTDVVELRLKKR